MPRTVDLTGTDADTLTVRKRFTFEGETYQPGEPVPAGMDQGKIEQLRRVGYLVHRAAEVGQTVRAIRSKGKK